MDGTVSWLGACSSKLEYLMGRKINQLSTSKQQQIKYKLNTSSSKVVVTIHGPKKHGKRNGGGEGGGGGGVGGGAGGGAVSTQILSQQSSQPYPIQPWQRPVGNTWQHAWSMGGGGKRGPPGETIGDGG